MRSGSWRLLRSSSLGEETTLNQVHSKQDPRNFPLLLLESTSFVPFLMSLALDLDFHRRMTFFPMLMVHTSCLACTIGVFTFFQTKNIKSLRFWTGYFTSRPALKRYIRDTSAFFQAEMGLLNRKSVQWDFSLLTGGQANHHPWCCKQK